MYGGYSCTEEFTTFHVIFNSSEYLAKIEKFRFLDLSLRKHVYAIFHSCKNGNFPMKNCDTFLTFA